MSEKDYLVTKSEDELRTWFCDNARFMPRANGLGKYFIRLGAKIYKDDDTLCLFNIVKGVLAEHRRNLTKRAADLLPCGHPKSSLVQLRFGSLPYCEDCKRATIR